MVLEATMIVVDNSEWMRNGDYTPTRIGAQNDAVNLIFSSKTQSNPENTVGLMTMAGKAPEVLATLTSDLGKILSGLHSIKVSGTAELTTGIQIAQLALKHRQNRNQRQRIVAFVGSPVSADEKTLVRLGKKMKKNNVAIDIINFGEQDENTSKLEAFINAVNSGDNSHLVTIPPGPHILSDMLISTPIIAGEDGAPSGFTGGGGSGGFEFGVDPNVDPELALALRISLEEDKARQEAAAAKAKAEAGAAEGTASAPTESSAAATDANMETIGADDDELQRALAMSDGDVDMEGLSEEDQIQRAIAMSMSDNNEVAGETDGSDIMSSVLSSLPGVDASDPRIQEALRGLEKKEDSNKDKK